MVMTDPIADMFTRIRNALHARHEKVELPASKMKLELARILKAEGYIKNYKLIQDKRQGILRIFLKYTAEGEPALKEIRRISKPGRRVYAGAQELPVVHSGLGISILSTSQGVMTDKEARKANLGGEVIGRVW